MNVKEGTFSRMVLSTGRQSSGRLYQGEFVAGLLLPFQVSLK